MSLTGIYNQEAADSAPDFSPVPAGIYTVMVTEAENKTADSGAGMLNMTMEIVDGEHKGRKLFPNICHTKKSGESNGFGHKQIGDLCTNIGFDARELTDEGQLKMKPIKVEVVIKPHEYQGKVTERNEVASFNPTATASETATPPANKPW